MSTLKLVADVAGEDDVMIGLVVPPAAAAAAMIFGVTQIFERLLKLAPVTMEEVTGRGLPVAMMFGVTQIFVAWPPPGTVKLLIVGVEVVIGRAELPAMM